MIVYSDHASKRMQQRCIKISVVEWLVAYGDEEPDGKGGLRLHVGSRAKKELKAMEQSLPFKVSSKLLRTYVVVGADGGCVITTGYLQRKRFTQEEWRNALHWQRCTNSKTCRVWQ